MPQFGNYNPATFGWTHPVQFAPYSYAGVPILGGINPAPGYATLLTAMLDALVPHIPGGLIPGQCWGGTTSDPVAASFHLFGLAVDLNAPENPMYGGAGNGHSFVGPGVLPADTGALIRPFGFEWGGDWQSPLDYMHVECHLTPQEVVIYANQLGDDMSAADVAAINAHTDAAIAHINAELDHIRTFIDGNPIKPSGFDHNGQAVRAQETLAGITRLLTKFSP